MTAHVPGSNLRCSERVMNPLPDLTDLVWAFECEPRYVYEEQDRAAGREMGWRAMWPYTRVVFDLCRGERRVSFDLEPGYEQARVRISDAQDEVLDLLLRRVRSIELDRAKGREILKISFVDGVHSDEVYLRLKPEISLGWEPFAIL